MSARWLRLGIALERIEPGHPEQNGRHERMHRTLKQETAMPPERTLRAQQRPSTASARSTTKRPHEALAMATPASLYEPSSRARSPAVCRRWSIRRASRCASSSSGRAM
ncbi:MAG: transposase [Bryobacterales bacterium]|nr:transposase [Bryobacterales bacterium]